MNKLVQVYSRSAGLEIRKPYIRQSFFPLEDKPYITIQGSSVNQNGTKNYDFWNEVLDVIAPLLSQNGIKIYQVGVKDEIPLRHCHHLMGQTTFAQVNYVLNNTICHLSIDSSSAHSVGALGRPLIALYGNTSSHKHGPYWFDPNKTFLIDSHRNGNKPSYGPEHDKTINKIPPEQIVNSVLQILNANARFNRQSLFFGQAYHQTVVEWVPDFAVDPNFLKGQPLTTRLDYSSAPESEQILVNVLQQRQLAIVTNRPLNLEWVRALKQNILLLSYEITENDNPQYIKELKQTGAKLRFFTKITDEQQLSDLRLKYFDITVIEKFQFKEKKNFWEESERYLNFALDKEKTILSNLLYRSKKFILSQGKIYPSKAALMQNLPINSFEQNVAQVLDSPEFWEEMDHFYIFKQ